MYGLYVLQEQCERDNDEVLNGTVADMFLYRIYAGLLLTFLMFLIVAKPFFLPEIN